MSVIEYLGEKIELTDEGYLADSDGWNENVAQALAGNEGVPQLTDGMMAIIRFMRSYYMSFQSFPVLNSVCKNVHQPRECVNDEFIDPLKAWKIAGLPEPGEEVIAYLKR